MSTFKCQGLSLCKHWLKVHHDPYKSTVHVQVMFHNYSDIFTMHENAIGVNGTNLIKEAYQRRAQLMVAYKIAKELEK